MNSDEALDMMPTEVITTLPSGQHCGVTISNIFLQIVMPLLINWDINKWSKYFFAPTPDNPFNINTFYDRDSSHFNDIVTSIWYERTNRMFVKDPDNEMLLVPICLFINGGTIISVSESLPLEPVMMSLMIHNQETRKNTKT